ncbi:alpha/beta fold hydrolase [Amycolatopsis cynarae]|uniref:Alpha/beta fold hydrolase n=1 Tax=Amycolatopsis cynarae TaxID=2995223 RepID=A0ABY7AT91_9PSEU|nr:alpha/beta fold hydrolase [Amycolatopsis sp. HUAS 11-8]WAL62952.1 alpha/beta fold hydrolase [Amycolatopsis sp. HUAS 11-8]
MTHIIDEPTGSLRRFGAAPSHGTTTLLCFPHAGGSASFFAPLADALAPDVTVLAAQYPGRQDRLAEPCLDAIGPLSDLMYRATRAVPPQPLVLFGHSMGAIVAFEVARRLELDGGPRPVRLIVSARGAPGRTRGGQPSWNNDNALLEEMRSLGGTDVGVLDDPDLTELVLPAMRADVKAHEEYRPVPGATVSVPITALLGEEDPTTSVEDVREWDQHTRSGFDLHLFPGGHFYLSPPPHAVVAALTEIVLGQNAR